MSGLGSQASASYDTRGLVESAYDANGLQVIGECGIRRASAGDSEAS
jgi:hypothetical protein